MSNNFVLRFIEKLLGLLNMQLIYVLDKYQINIHEFWMILHPGAENIKSGTLVFKVVRLSKITDLGCSIFNSLLEVYVRSLLCRVDHIAGSRSGAFYCHQRSTICPDQL